MSTGIIPDSALHPPIVTIATSPALTSSSAITVARVALTTALSRFGCVMITPGLRSGSPMLDIAAEDTCLRGFGGQARVRARPARGARRRRAAAFSEAGVELQRFGERQRHAHRDRRRFSGFSERGDGQAFGGAF